MRFVQFLGCSLVLMAACKKAPPEPAKPRVGWVQDEGWKGACYFPKDYASLGQGERRLEWANTIKEIVAQWNGARNDGVAIDETVALNVETVLLGRPERVEEVAVENLRKCEAFMAGGSVEPWQSWLTGLPKALTVGECNTPLVDTWFNYLDIAKGWQNRAPICKGNVVQIIGSEIDYYRIVAKGPWINAAGDASQPTNGKRFPCDMEGCLAGMLIVRFTGESGTELIQPVGLGRVFTAPEHGHIEIEINDDAWEDNVYKVEGGMTHHTSITYKPG